MEGQRKRMHPTGTARNVLRNPTEELRVLLLTRGHLRTDLGREGKPSVQPLSDGGDSDPGPWGKDNVDMTSDRAWEGPLGENFLQVFCKGCWLQK